MRTVLNWQAPLEHLAERGIDTPDAVVVHESGSRGSGQLAIYDVLRGTAPQGRSHEQKLLLAAHMRECKGKLHKKQKKRLDKASIESIGKVLDSCLLRENASVKTRLLRNRDDTPLLKLVIHRPGDRLGESDGNHNYMSAQTCLRLSYTDGVTDHSLGNLARTYNIHRKTASRSIALSAHIYKHFANEAVESVVACERPLAFAMCLLAWDETSHVLTLPIHPLLNPSQQKSSWHVLVSELDFLFGWGSWENNDPFFVQMMSYARPPVPLMSTSAGAIFDGLFYTVHQK
jgi:predicted DNA-binding protein YlxM (UPF0122 family)